MTSKIKLWRHIMILITKIIAYVIIVYMNLIVFWLFEFLNW